jgi:hypothetical protein
MCVSLQQTGTSMCSCNQDQLTTKLLSEGIKYIQTPFDKGAELVYSRPPHSESMKRRGTLTTRVVGKIQQNVIKESAPKITL